MRVSSSFCEVADKQFNKTSFQEAQLVDEHGRQDYRAERDEKPEDSLNRQELHQNHFGTGENTDD